MEASRLCFQATWACIKAVFLPGTCSINPPLTATLGMGVLHQIMIGWALLTAAGHSSCSVFHAAPGCWLPFQNRPRTPGESEHLGGQRSSEGEGRSQNPIEGPFSDLAETILPEEQWECHCKSGCSVLRAAKHSTVRTGGLGLSHHLCEDLPSLDSPNSTRMDRVLTKERGRTVVVSTEMQRSAR